MRCVATATGCQGSGAYTRGPGVARRSSWRAWPSPAPCVSLRATARDSCCSLSCPSRRLRVRPAVHRLVSSYSATPAGVCVCRGSLTSVVPATSCCLVTGADAEYRSRCNEAQFGFFSWASRLVRSHLVSGPLAIAILIGACAGGVVAGGSGPQLRLSTRGGWLNVLEAGARPSLLPPARSLASGARFPTGRRKFRVSYQRRISSELRECRGPCPCSRR